MARPEISNLRFGKINLIASAITAGTISRVLNHKPILRVSISGGDRRSAKSLFAGVDDAVEWLRDEQIELREKPERQADHGGNDKRNDEPGAVHGWFV